VCNGQRRFAALEITLTVLVIEKVMEKVMLKVTIIICEEEVALIFVEPSSSCSVRLYADPWCGGSAGIYVLP